MFHMIKYESSFILHFVVANLKKIVHFSHLVVWAECQATSTSIVLLDVCGSEWRSRVVALTKHSSTRNSMCFIIFNEPYAR